MWVPDDAHEAMRDLIRARATAVRVLGKARQHLQGFLLRHGRIYAGKKGWTLAYRRWLTTVRFEHPAQQIVLQDYIHAVNDAESRVERLTQQIGDLAAQLVAALPSSPALQAMRGVGLIVAVTLVARGRRLQPLRQSSPVDGLSRPGAVLSTPAARTVHRGGITKAGNALARRVLIEGAWTYRMQARVSRKLHDRIEGLPQTVRDIAWKAQVRLCTRYRRLAAAGKAKVVVTTASLARWSASFGRSPTPSRRPARLNVCQNIAHRRRRGTVGEPSRLL